MFPGERPDWRSSHRRFATLFPFLLAVQLTATDSAFPGDSLRALVDRATIVRHEAIARASAQHAVAESEIAILRRHGEEVAVVQVEGTRSRISWRTASGTRQYVFAYRAGVEKPRVSALSLLRRPWVIAGPGGGDLELVVRWPGAVSEDEADAAVAVHPFELTQDSLYTWAGGDTTTITLPTGDSMLVRRVRVVPRPDAAREPLLLFRGEIDLEPGTGEVVRTRGRIVITQRSRSYWRRLVRRGIRSVAVVDLVNERTADGTWVPSRQRVELQLESPVTDEAGAILRVTTRLTAQHVTTIDEPPCPHVAAADDDADRLTIAPADSLADDGFHTELGATTAEAPPIGPDEFRVHDQRASVAGEGPDSADAIPVVGAVRGWIEDAERLRKRFTVPNVQLGATVRRGWSDGDLHGAVGVGWREGAWMASVGFEHELLRGGGLLPMPGGEESIAAFRFGTGGSAIDRGTLVIAHAIGGRSGARIHLQAGPAGDRALPHPYPLAAPCQLGFRENYPALIGRNFRTRAAVKVGERIAEAYGPSGFGSGVRYQRVDCETSRRHVEGHVIARARSGIASWAMRLEGAAASISHLPEMALGVEHFAGPLDAALETPQRRRAARLRLSAGMQMPQFAAPLRPLFWLYVPSGIPSLVLTLEGWWRESHIKPLEEVALRRTTVGSGVELTLRPFGGAVGVGIGRAITGPPGWRFVLAADPGF